MDSVVTLNVGGVLYTTSQTTSTHYPDSMLGNMFSGRIPTARDKEGNYFIDRDGKLFRFILNYLRDSVLTLPKKFEEWEALESEANFYQIQPLIDEIGIQKPVVNQPYDDLCFSIICILERYPLDTRKSFPTLLVPKVSDPAEKAFIDNHPALQRLREIQEDAHREMMKKLPPEPKPIPATPSYEFGLSEWPERPEDRYRRENAFYTSYETVVRVCEQLLALKAKPALFHDARVDESFGQLNYSGQSLIPFRIWTVELR